MAGERITIWGPTPEKMKEMRALIAEFAAKGDSPLLSDEWRGLLECALELQKMVDGWAWDADAIIEAGSILGGDQEAVGLAQLLIQDIHRFHHPDSGEDPDRDPRAPTFLSVGQELHPEDAEKAKDLDRFLNQKHEGCGGRLMLGKRGTYLGGRDIWVCLRCGRWCFAQTPRLERERGWHDRNARPDY